MITALFICTFLLLFFLSDDFRQLLSNIWHAFAENIGPLIVISMFCVVILFGIIGAIRSH
jgi:hypothetical protein